MTGTALDIPNLETQTIKAPGIPAVGSLNLSARKLGRNMPCVFDYTKGRQDKRRLQCIRHKHAGFETSILLLPRSTTLADLLSQDRLAGEALEDAKSETRDR
jgi:hypothetical protein